MFSVHIPAFLRRYISMILETISNSYASYNMLTALIDWKGGGILLPMTETLLSIYKILLLVYFISKLQTVNVYFIKNSNSWKL